MELWAYRAAAALIAAAAAVALWRGDGSLVRREDLWLLPALLLAGWALLQVLPLPPAALGLLSPQAHRVYTETVPGYPGAAPYDWLPALEEKALARAREPIESLLEATGNREPAPARAAAGGGSTRMPLSLHPAATVERLSWYLALGLGFLLVRRRVADRDVYRVYRGALFVAFVALALFGLLQHFSWNGKIYWIRPLPDVTRRAFGPYVNPNHFAGVMELAVPWMVAHGWSRVLRAKEQRDVARALLFLEGAAACLVAGLLTGSRMASLLLVSSLLVIGFRALPTWRLRSAVAGGALAAGLLAGVLLAGSPAALVQRAGDAGGAVLASSRWGMWKASIPAVRDYVATGSGFGAFAEVFPGYVPTGAYKVFDRADNDYLEFLVGGGAVAALLLAWLGWGFWTRLLRSLRASQWSLGRLGPVVGIGALTAHALVDFNHQMPANALLFVVVCAMALARADRSPAPLRSGRPRGRVLLGAAALVLVAVYGYRGVTGTVGGIALSRGLLVEERDEYEAAAALVERGAIGGERFRALRKAAQSRLALWSRQARRSGTANADEALLDAARTSYVAALQESPVAWQPWLGLARVYQRREQLVQARDGREDDPPGRDGLIALGFARSSVERAPHWYEPYDRLSMLLWDYGFDEDAVTVTRASARVLPIFWHHVYRRSDDLPRRLLDAFSVGAWEVLGKTAMLREDRHLLALGKLELRRKDYGRAAAALMIALETGREEKLLVEASFYLGLVFVATERYEEARPYLERSSRHPSFRKAARQQLARIEARVGGE